jgi:two-component system OmpR family sensor kinase
LLIAGIGGAFLTTRVLSRVKQMAQAAATIGAKDLSRRLPVVGNDEFAGLAETFNELLARVEIAFQEQARVVEQQRRFTADASHELKTPLTLIRGTTSLALSDNGILDRQSTTDIDNAAASMSELVQDLIFLARADAGQLGKKRIDLLLLDPLQRAVDLISPISEAPINFMQAHECLSVNADESDMVRLFSNILQNAAYHTPSGGRIIVSLSSTLTDAIVMINDSGVGIAPQHVEHLGERFYRVDSSRTRSSEIIGGSGLGLAICIGIVEAHGGTMKIDSILGKGTTVTITLPRVNVIAC